MELGFFLPVVISGFEIYVAEIIRTLQNLKRNQGAHTRFSISTEHMNDNDKRGLTLFLKIFTFQELNSIFHKLGIVFFLAVGKNCRTVILVSFELVVEVKFMPSNIKCSSKILTVLLG